MKTLFLTLRLVLASMAFLLTSVGLPARAEPLNAIAKIRASNEIAIGYRESSIPFSYLDAQQKPVGYAIDLCLQIVGAVKDALKMPGLQVRWVPVTSSTRMQAMADGKTQLECGSTTHTLEREKMADFTIPHFISSARFLVRSNSGIQKIDDLRGKRVVSTAGTTNIGYLKTLSDDRKLDMVILSAREHSEAFAMVAEGKADAFEMDDVLLYGLRAQSPHPADFQVIGERLSVEPYAIMLPKGDVAFKRIVDNEMYQLINNFQINAYYKKWFEQPIPPKGINMELPMPFLLRDSLKFPSDKIPGD